MSELTRFSVSIDKTLLDRFDRWIANEGYATRSQAVSGLVASTLVEQNRQAGAEIAGAVVMVYDHHKRNLSGLLTRIQHDFHHLIVSSQHVHLDHDTCLELIVVRGAIESVESLLHRLKAVKGVDHVSLATATSGFADTRQRHDTQRH